MKVKIKVEIEAKNGTVVIQGEGDVDSLTEKQSILREAKDLVANLVMFELKGGT